MSFSGDNSVANGGAVKSPNIYEEVSQKYEPNLQVMSLELNRSLIHEPKLLFGVEFGATSHQLNGFSQRNAELRPPRCNTAV